MLTGKNIMFDRVMSWLSSEADGKNKEFEDDDVRLATAALFYHVIAVDGRVKVEEMQRLHALLKERFDVDGEQLELLEQRGKDADLNSPGLFPFTVILNRELDQQERQRIYSHLESLAMADGVEHELERDFLGHIKAMLKLDS